MSACPCVFLSEHMSYSFYLFTDCISMRMCVFDRVAWTTGLTLELKLAAFLAPSLGGFWAEQKKSLAGLLIRTCTRLPVR